MLEHRSSEHVKQLRAPEVQVRAYESSDPRLCDHSDDFNMDRCRANVRSVITNA